MSLWRDRHKYSAGIKVAFVITLAQIAITFATVLLLVFR